MLLTIGEIYTASPQIGYNDLLTNTLRVHPRGTTNFSFIDGHAKTMPPLTQLIADNGKTYVLYW